VVKEQLAIVVSGLNVSSYCLLAHLEILCRLGIDKAIGPKLALNYPCAG
jgi:AhpD family alkylhydroperoxidase